MFLPRRDVEKRALISRALAQIGIAVGAQHVDGAAERLLIRPLPRHQYDAGHHLVADLQHQPDLQEERDAARWPLRLLTAPGYFQAHTAYSGVGFLRRREGEPYCVVHPEEAQRRGLADGAKVRLFNERGEVGLVLKISDEVLPGVVLVPGQRPDQETLAGTVNMLCSDRYTDLGDGATYQSTFLDIALWREQPVAST